MWRVKIPKWRSLLPFKLSVVDENRYSAASAVCDLIIKQSDGIIEEASGLYVDGELIGAVKSSADLRYILQNILNAAKEGDTDAEAAFAQNVETVSGLFPTNSIMTTEEMESLLTGTEKDAVLYTVKAGDTATSIAQDHNLTLTELASINQFSDIDVLHEGDLLNIEMAVPKLSVNIMKNQEYDVDIPYKDHHTEGRQPIYGLFQGHHCRRQRPATLCGPSHLSQRR